MKNLLYKKGKKTLGISLILLSFLAIAVLKTNASTATVSVEPPDVTIPNIGETYIVNVTVTNIEDCYAFEFKLYYEPTVVNCTKAEMPPDHFMADGVLVAPAPIYESNYVYVGVSLQGAVPGKTGNGTLYRITFEGIGLGSSTLELREVEFYDSEINDIIFTVDDGNITVIPEFPTALIAPLFMIATLVAVALVKTWSKKHREPTIVQ